MIVGIGDPDSPGNVWRPQFKNAVTAALSNTVNLEHPAVELYIGGAGDIKVDMAGGAAGVTFVGVGVGRFPISVTRVYLTGTTATGIVVLY